MTDLVQTDADLMGWKTIRLNAGQIVGLRTPTARDGGGGRRRGRTCIEQVRFEGPRIIE